MKKFLSFLLLFALLLLSLSACADSDDGHGKPTVLGEESSELISALVKYLGTLRVSYEIEGTSVEIKIDKIKNGARPLLVEFDASKSYYVCGYYKGEHAHKREQTDYCCTSEYLWLQYEKAEDIRENYRGNICVVSFQLSPASSVTDIRPGKETAPAFEHFAKVKTVFEDGYNTENFEDFNRIFITLNSDSKDRVYYTTSAYYDTLVTFYCVEMADQIFIPVPMYDTRSDGTRYDYDLMREFGKYYDDLMGIIVIDSYKESSEDGTNTLYYGLFPIKDFAESVLK